MSREPAAKLQLNYYITTLSKNGGSFWMMNTLFQQSWFSWTWSIWETNHSSSTEPWLWEDKIIPIMVQEFLLPPASRKNQFFEIVLFIKLCQTFNSISISSQLPEFLIRPKRLASLACCFLLQPFTFAGECYVPHSAVWALQIALDNPKAFLQVKQISKNCAKTTCNNQLKILFLNRKYTTDKWSL